MSDAEQAQIEEDVKYLVDNMDSYPDFPKPGINFRLVVAS